MSHEVAGDNSVLDFWLSGYLSRGISYSGGFYLLGHKGTEIRSNHSKSQVYQVGLIFFNVTQDKGQIKGTQIAKEEVK